jgi:hypothetical protein
MLAQPVRLAPVVVRPAHQQHASAARAPQEEPGLQDLRVDQNAFGLLQAGTQGIELLGPDDVAKGDTRLLDHGERFFLVVGLHSAASQQGSGHDDGTAVQ